MSAQQLLLDRIEFARVSVQAAPDFRAQMDKAFAQLRFDFNDITFLVRSSLSFPDEEAGDPRHFALTYGIKLDSKSQVSGLTIPYEVEVEATAFLRWEGGEDYKGVDRFRAVRHSGYQILYGAMREMVCNLTARGRYGMWQLPARRFDAVAKDRAEDDEKARLEVLAQKQPRKKQERLASGARAPKTRSTARKS